MSILNFYRMNGLGNDFLIYDARKQENFNRFSQNQILELCHRDNELTGGCDQLIIIENATNADARMVIYNSDGGEVDACGNATRCVVGILSDELGRAEISLISNAGLLSGTKLSETEVTVNMGEPIFDWKNIPLSEDVDTNNLPIKVSGFDAPFAVSMGNPHMVFTTEQNINEIDVVNLGTELEHNALFPERANVGFAQIIDRENIALRVFERGAGETLACGTGACAAVVAAISRDLTDRVVNVKTNGGLMVIEWNKEKNNILMTGPIEFEKEIEIEKVIEK